MPVSQDVVEVKCAALLGGEAFRHQVEDVKAVLVRTQVGQTRLLQHVGVQTGWKVRLELYFNQAFVNYIFRSSSDDFLNQFASSIVTAHRVK